MSFTIIDAAITAITGMATGTIAIMGHLVTNLWPVLVGIFLLFGIWGYIKYKAKGIGR